MKEDLKARLLPLVRVDRACICASGTAYPALGALGNDRDQTGLLTAMIANTIKATNTPIARASGLMYRNRVDMVRGLYMGKTPNK